MTAKILIVDPDASLGRFLADRGHLVVQTKQLESLLALVDAEGPAAVLVPADGGMDVLPLCRALHDRGGLFVLVLATDADIAERIALYEAGADDVIVGTAPPVEIDARLRALLRRRAGPVPPDLLIVGDLRVDRARHRVTRCGEEIPLTLTEFNLLEYLARRKNTALTRKEILAAVWGGAVDGFTNIVDVYVNYLRKKIERADRPRLLKTVRGVGYLLEDPVVGGGAALEAL